MSLQEEIKKINEKIEALNKDMQSLMSELDAGVENEFPQDGDVYWLINTAGETNWVRWHGVEIENKRLSFGNVFKTKEEADFALEKLKVEAELRKFSRPFEPMTDNFFMIYDKYLGSLENNCSLKTDIQGVIYFGSREEIQKAAETVGIERIKKYIFGVED